jgi:ferredoxin-type protein NapG
MRNRRGFLQKLTFTATVLVAGGMPYGIARLLTPSEKEDDSRTHLRPPGALKDDESFIAACIACGLCAEVCPPRCIDFYDREGGRKANTPFINPEKKGCILCDKCMEVCPTEALVKITHDEIDMGIAQIDRTACYPWVDRGICGACVVVCPLGEKAISFDFANVYRPIVKQGCVGCGLCVEVCPHPSLPIWIVERSKGTVATHSV